MIQINACYDSTIGVLSICVLGSAEARAALAPLIGEHEFLIDPLWCDSTPLRRRIDALLKKRFSKPDYYVLTYTSL